MRDGRFQVSVCVSTVEDRGGSEGSSRQLSPQRTCTQVTRANRRSVPLRARTTTKVTYVHIRMLFPRHLACVSR